MFRYLCVEVLVTPVLMADAAEPRQGGADRKVVEVAVGVLIRSDGRFLLTSRPPGKVYEGYWEFPGGKLEQGESVEQALPNATKVLQGVLDKPAAS